MKREFSISVELSAPPDTVFQTWLSSKGHSSMTGSPAKVEPRVGGSFTAWDGYITGKTLELKPHARIVQSWRTGDFADSDPDSKIELTFEAVPDGTKLTLKHTGIPSGQAESYESGWEEWYFAPMRTYFDT